MNVSPDPLIEAIRSGGLTSEQRDGLADVMQVLVDQASDGSVSRPGMLMDLTIEDATRWQALVAALRVNRGALYPARERL